MHHGIVQRRALQVLRIQQFHDVHLGGVDGDRHLIRFGRQFGQHVAGVVRQPLGRFAFAFRSKGNRTTDLDDHVRHRFTHTGNQFVELGQALGPLAIELAHMQVQHGRASFVAVDRLLHLLVHGQRDVFGKVLRHPLGAVWGHGDHHLFHGFRVQGIVEELHGLLQFL
ncbi:hypothetical protein D3C73_1126860 [compost metagenome]